MKFIKIRDLRRRWPEVEAALQLGEEVAITRDSKPVAKLVSLSEDQGKRPRWNAEEHARWQKELASGETSDSDSALAESRADRRL